MCFDLINTSAFPKLCKTKICTFFCCPNKHNHFHNIKFIVCCFRHSTENNQQCFHNSSSLSSNLQAYFFFKEWFFFGQHFGQSFFNCYDTYMIIPKNSIFYCFCNIHRIYFILHRLEWLFKYFSNFSTLDCLQIQ